MKALKIKNKKYQSVFCKKEKISLLYKFLLIELIKKNQTKQNVVSKIKMINSFRNFYLNRTKRIRITTRCIFTNRSRGVVKKYGASRFVLRDIMQFGVLTGYKKSVW